MLVVSKRYEPFQRNCRASWNKWHVVVSSKIVSITVCILAIGEGTSTLEKATKRMFSKLLMLRSKFQHRLLQFSCNAVQGTMTASLTAVATSEQNTVGVRHNHFFGVLNSFQKNVSATFDTQTGSPQFSSRM